MTRELGIVLVKQKIQYMIILYQMLLDREKKLGMLSLNVLDEFYLIHLKGK